MANKRTHKSGSRGNILTKSKFLHGLQCPLLLWTEMHYPERIPKPDAATLKKFEAGDVVGELAKKVFPGGIDLPHEDFFGNIELTREALKKRKPLFEAGLMSGRFFSRLDILEPSGKAKWNIVEVKSSGSVKEVHIQDVAFQLYCAKELGLAIDKCYLMHLDTDYVKNGDIEPSELFARDDITKAVHEYERTVGKKAASFLKIIDSKTTPKRGIGPWCKTPYSCDLMEECWRFLPERSVFDLYGAGKKAFALYEDGILAIKDIPDDFRLNMRQLIQKKCEEMGSHHADIEAIKDFLAQLEYPLHFMDFETVNPAIPLYDGTSPFQQIPFQFAMFVIEKKGAKPKRKDFLAEGKEDPRPAFLAALKSAIGDKGSIVAYNKAFENGVVRKLGQSFPGNAAWAEDVVSRTIDLLDPFRSFDYYHPAQKGSASIKNVLPALTGVSYEGMEISEGGAASDAFMAFVSGGLTEKEKKKIRVDLLAYCGQDTEGMVWILKELEKVVN